MNFLPTGAAKWVAGTSGGEWAGPCPWCGGTDRFRVWPEHPKGQGGRYMCRQCGQQGDAIAFLMNLGGMSYLDSCRALQLPAKPTSTRRGTGVKQTIWTPKHAVIPSATWQARAEAFTAECAESIASDPVGMSYTAQRGLSQETVLRLGIGWNATDRWESREAWGLAPELNGNGNPKKVMLPAGLVIPTRRRAGITAVKVRRTAWTPDDQMPKYMALPGSVPGMALGRGNGLPVVVVESELDAMLVWQEASDLVNVLALGTASGKPDVDAAGLLLAAPRILVSLDCDQAGEEGARWWPKHFANTVRWPVVRGKDIGDMVNAGLVGVHNWIAAGVRES